MNIFVCIKQVPDTETKVKILPDKSGIDPAGIKWIISPYDEFAIEEALRLKEKNAGSTVTVFSAGPARVVDALRTALAMGADSAVHVDAPENADSFMTAKALAAAVQKEGAFQVLFCGKEAIDDGASQVAQLLSVQLKLPLAAVVLNAEYAADKIRVKREVEGGMLEVVDLPVPCLISAQKGLNEPRYASLPNIMKAKKKEVKALKAADLGISASDQKIKLKNFEIPPPKPAGRKLSGDVNAQVAELVKALKNEAKVL